MLAHGDAQLAGSTALYAQGGSAISSATVSDPTTTVGEQISVDISLDFTNVASPDDALGSFTGTLSWNPDVLAYGSDSGIQAGFSGLVNPSPNHVVFNGVNVNGAAGDSTILTITFDVVGPGSSELDLEYSAVTAAGTFANLIPGLVVNDGSIQANPLETHDIQLSQGWNTISTYLDPADPYLPTLLSGIRDDMVIMKNGAGDVYWPDLDYNSIGDWNVRQGYMIYMKRPAILSIAGKAVDPAQTPIELTAGWSLVAYLHSASMPLTSALETVSDSLYLAKNWTGKVYWPTYGTEQFTNMIPGQAYYLYMKRAATLTYPTNTSNQNFSLQTAVNEPVLVSPGDNTSGVSSSANLEVSVSDPDGDQLTVTFYGRPADSETPAEAFTIIAMPDTQHYTDVAANEANFAAQTQWIVDNKEARNIRFVTGLGDIVQKGNRSDHEWQLADVAYSLIEDPSTTLLTDGIPYGLSVGNHDQSPIGDGSDASTAKFNEYFGTTRFSGRDYYGGHYGSDNDNSYQLFSAGGMDFIAIHLEYDTSPEQAVLDWADALLTTYSDRRAIVTSHFMIWFGNPAFWSSQGLAIYNALSDHENLFLMLGGHVYGEGRRQDTAVNGNVVNTLLSNYQEYPNGGNGLLRIMTFEPATDTIQVQTYSPVLDQFETDDSSEFTLTYDMQGDPAFQKLGVVTVPSDSSANITWQGLEELSGYEWYATADDGTTSSTSDIWRFTTAAADPLDEPPDTVMTAAPSDPSPFTTATFAFAGKDNLTHPVDLTFECQLDNGGSSACSSPVNYSGLAEGLHTFTVRATDQHNNIELLPASHTWMIDSTPPVPMMSTLGDVDTDQAVNSTDGLLILSCEVGLDTSPHCPTICGDVNEDGVSNSTDALGILSYEMGMSVPFPVAGQLCNADP